MSQLTAPYVLEYSYRRSTGPVIGRFLTGLRERRIEGVRLEDGRVMVPPLEYDPTTGRSLSEWVEVGQEGVVETAVWVPNPRTTHPLDTPFFWAMIRLDGADVALAHVISADHGNAVGKGTRVRVRWANETVGFMTDITCFEVVS